MKNLLFLIVPACVWLAVVPLREAWGHYYYALHSDPSYLYLFNGLNIARCQSSFHVDNPGSTVQLLSAAVIRITAFFRNTNDIQKDVILHSEFYITVINRTMFSICLLSLFLLGVTACRYTGNLLWSFFLQAVPFVSWQTMRIFLKVSPEMMMSVACILWIGTLLRLSAKNDFRENHLVYTVWLAVLTGFSLATKLTMIPFVVIPLMLLPLRVSVNYLLLSFIFFMLMIFPAWKHFDYLLHWLKRLFLHSSLYGSGEPNIIQLPEAFFSLTRLIALEHPFYLAVLCAATLLIMAFANKSLREPARHSVNARILQSLIVAVLIQLVLVAKHFNPHYLIPSLMLFTAIIYFSAKLFTEIRSQNPDFFPRMHHPANKAGWLVLLLTLLFLRHHLKNLPGNSVTQWLAETLLSQGFWLLIIIITFGAIAVLLRRYDSQKKTPGQFLNASLVVVALTYCLRHADLAGFRSRLIAEAKDSEGVMREISERYSDYTVILGERSSSLSYALKYGTNENIPQPHYHERMKELLQKGEYFWQHSEKFKTWTEEITLKEILQRHSKVMLECDARFTPLEKLRELEETEDVSLQNVYQGKSARLYIIQPRNPSI